MFKVNTHIMMNTQKVMIPPVPSFTTIQFTATLSQPRRSILGGNTELYSNNQSFANGFIWKFTIAPTSGPYWNVSGFIEKINGAQNISFTTAEAENAVKGNFRAVANVVVRPDLNIFINFANIFSDNQIAFTLRIEKLAPLCFRNALQDCQSKTLGDETFTITTSPMKTEEQVINVYGHLIVQTQPGHVPSLSSCAEILAKCFPKYLITWLTYCTDAERWKNFLC